MSEKFEVRVEVGFEARHRAAGDGSEAPEHAHRWKVAVHARSQRLDAIAIVVDFRRLRDDAEELLGELDGTVLEEHGELGNGPVTALTVGRWIRGRLAAQAAGESWEIHAVEVECDPGIRYLVTADD